MNSPLNLEFVMCESVGMSVFHDRRTVSPLYWPQEVVASIILTVVKVGYTAACAVGRLGRVLRPKYREGGNSFKF